MSEPSQLIARIPISEAGYRRYLDHRIGPASDFPGFAGWLSDKRWAGAQDASAIVAEAAQGLRVRDWLRTFTEGPGADWFQPTLDRHDPASETWTFVVYGYGENYVDFTSALNALRQVAGYQDRAGGGHVAIVPHAFGGGFDAPDAIVEIRDGQARFVDAAPPAFAAYALQTFERLETPGAMDR